MPRANPYPVVTPMAKSTSARAVASTVAYTYPRLPAPSESPRSSSSSSFRGVGAVAGGGGGVRPSANHARDKPDPQDRAVPRANPYPVVTPMSKSARSVASGVADTYPHIPAPSPTSSSLQRAGNYAKETLRVCMRSGCGARLPARVLGDTCQACSGAGIVRPSTPREVVQKRATDRTRPRSRESRSCDLVRPVSRPFETGIVSGETQSLVSIQSPMRETPRGASTATTERKDVEDEMEVDLVYPDVGFSSPLPPFACSSSPEDIPVATPCTSTKDVESEMEVDLVYPDVGISSPFPLFTCSS